MIYKGKFLVKKERDLDGSFIFVDFLETKSGKYEIVTTDRPTQFYGDTATMEVAKEVIFPNVRHIDECELVDAVITVGEGG